MSHVHNTQANVWLKFINNQAMIKSIFFIYVFLIIIFKYFIIYFFNNKHYLIDIMLYLYLK